jgi:LytR cell envelope-related transcriptional attenuator
VEPRAEGEDDTQVGRPLSPEEVAREFLREGGGVAREERIEEVRLRRRVRIPARVATAAGIAGAVAVLVLLAVVALLPSHPPSPPRAAGGALPQPTDSPVVTSPSTATTTTTVTLPPPASVTVVVLNAYGSSPLAPETALRLISAGFAIRGTGNAPSLIAGDNPSEIFYGPSGFPAAETLAQWLHGPVKEVSSANLSGNDLELWIANPLLGVNTTTTTTTQP